MIACYRRPYNTEGIEKIKKLLNEKNPNKIILLTIAERKKTGRSINSYLGKKDVKKLENQYEKDQENRSKKYANEILKISESMNTPTKKIQKKGNITEIIKNELDNFNPDFLVIHHSDKSRIDKMITGSIEDEISEKYGNSIVVV